MKVSVVIFAAIFILGLGCAVSHQRSASWEYLTFERWDYPGLNTNDFSAMYAFPWKRQLQIYQQQGWSIDSVTFKTNHGVGAAIIKLKHLNSDSDGLTLHISVPSREVKPDGTVSAFLILSNGSPQSIRFSMLANPIREVGPGDRFDVSWMPGFHFSDGWTSDQFVQSVQTLQPSKSAEWPFEMIVGSNQVLHVTAHYIASLADYPEADLWYGQVDAQPLTIQFHR